MKPKKIFHQVFVFIVLLIILSCCKNNDDRSQETLNSLQKINDYAFYTMTYYGDYGFKNYLETGQWPSFFSASKPNTGRYGCTCFTAMGSDSCRLFGRNFDWISPVSLLLYTDPPGGYASVSMVGLGDLGYSESNLPDLSQNREALFRAPYYPVDGMNEHGVTIALMLIDHAEPPYSKGKNTIYTNMVVRLVLDNARNIDEAINLISNYNISFGDGPCHYLISDPTGRSVIIEFLNGEIKVINNTDKRQVSTNFIITGTSAPDNVGCWRYNRAYSKLKVCQGNISPGEAMDILSKVAQLPPYNTMWSMVYNTKTLEALISINRNYSKQYLFKIGEKTFSTREVNIGGCNRTNIALKKSATSSSNENSTLVPDNAVDGDLNTRWSSGWSDPQWITIDLGSEHSIDEVSLYWENASAKKYQILVSTDGNTWIKAYSTDTSDGGNECIDFTQVTARYIKMLGTERWTNYGYSLWEFQVHDN